MESRMKQELMESERLILIEEKEPIDLIAFAERLGVIQEWSFGKINSLVRDPAKRNYLYTDRAVPFHWDGAFAARVPRYIVFQCLEAPSTGGETLFTDGVKLLEETPGDTIEVWRNVRITYSTEKIVHYGAHFTSPLIARHPVTGEEVLRFAEPVHDLNPVTLQGASDALIADLSRRLHARAYAHRWRPNQILIADNFAVLHGRNAFEGHRHLQRVN